MGSIWCRCDATVFGVGCVFPQTCTIAGVVPRVVMYGCSRATSYVSARIFLTGVVRSVSTSTAHGRSEHTVEPRLATHMGLRTEKGFFKPGKCSCFSGDHMNLFLRGHVPVEFAFFLTAGSFLYVGVLDRGLTVLACVVTAPLTRGSRYVTLRLGRVESESVHPCILAIL